MKVRYGRNMYEDLRIFFELRFSQGAGWTTGLVAYVVTVVGISLLSLYLRQVGIFYRVAAVFVAVVVLSPVAMYPLLTDKAAEKVAVAIESGNTKIEKMNGKIRISEKDRDHFLIQLDEADYRTVCVIAREHGYALPQY